MKIDKANETFGHRIVGGSEYQWSCYGPNVRYLDYESAYAYGSVLYNTVTQEIYEATIDDKEYKHLPYRWLNPSTVEKYKDECLTRGIDYEVAWDDVKWCDLEVYTDWCDKASAMFNGLPFDTRVVVPLDLDEDVILALALEAHKRDITLNKMIELLLKNAIEVNGSIA